MSLSQAPYNPGLVSEKRKLRKYIGLRVASSMLRVFGLLLTIAAVVMGVRLFAEAPAESLFIPAISAVSSFFTGLLFWTIGEAALVFIDIANNTAPRA